MQVCMGSSNFTPLWAPPTWQGSAVPRGTRAWRAAQPARGTRRHTACTHARTHRTRFLQALASRPGPVQVLLLGLRERLIGHAAGQKTTRTTSLDSRTYSGSAGDTPRPPRETGSACTRQTLRSATRDAPCTIGSHRLNASALRSFRNVSYSRLLITRDKSDMVPHDLA